MNTYKVLIDNSISGDRSSQSQLYALVAPKVYSTCLLYTKNKADADDVMQESFIKVFNKLHQYKSQNSFEGWVKKIVINTALEKIRSTSNLYAVLDIDKVPDIKISAENALQKLEAKELYKMVMNLPLMCRLVFNMHVIDGMKHAEIAQNLNISEGTSKSNLWNAKQILQKQISWELAMHTKTSIK